MTAPSIDSVVGGFASTVGRYFSIVSFIPSLLLVSWIVFLVRSGAWTRPPNWNSALKAFAEPTIVGAILLVLTSLMLSIALHPLQFVLVQLLEGYWGSGAIAIALAEVRARNYLEIRALFLERAEFADGKLGAARTKQQPDELSLLHAILKQEGARQITYFPRKILYLMPTRLGNVLRTYETQAGAQYNLSILDFADHLAQVAPREQVEYVSDQRTALDLAVRFCFVGLVASLITVLFLWQHGIALMVALVPYLLAYGSYRGAIVVAYHYGKAFSTLVDLNRFALYERLRLEIPADTVKEREQGTRLTRLVRYSPDESLDYVVDKPSDDEATPEGGESKKQSS